MTSPLIHSNRGTSLTSSAAIWKQSYRVSWEISMNPDLIPQLTNHDLKPPPELGGIFNGPPNAHQRQAFFYQFDCVKKQQNRNKKTIKGKERKIKHLEPREVLSLNV